MKMDSLDNLLIEELRDVYDAEKQITRALPKMTKAVHSEALRDALEEHLEVTKGQIGRLEEIFEMLNEKPRSHSCAGMKGIIEEGGELLKTDKKTTSENLKDAAIIAAAQKVEHYEISAYGTLRTHAERLGNERIAKLLEQTKEEEAEADRKLTQISEELLESESMDGQGTGEEQEQEEVEMAHSRNGGHRESRRSSSARGRRS